MVIRAAIAQHFNENTPIDGFAFISQSKRAWQVGFWGGLMACLALMTVYDLYGLSVRFIENPTSTSIEVVTNQQPTTPNMGFCVPLYLDDILEYTRVEKVVDQNYLDLAAEISEDADLFGLGDYGITAEDFQEILNPEVHDFAFKGWNETEAGIVQLLQDLDAQNKSLLTEPWDKLAYNRELTLVIGKYLVDLSGLENAGARVDYERWKGDYLAHKIENMEFFETEDQLRREDRLMTIVYDHLKSNNRHRDLSLLQQKLGEHVCNLVKFDVSGNFFSNNHDAVPVGLQTCYDIKSWLDTDTICFTVNSFTYETPNDQAVITFDLKPLYPSFYNEDGTLNATRRLHHDWPFVPQAQLTLNSEYQVMGVTGLNEGQENIRSTRAVVAVEIAAEYKSLPVKKNCNGSDTLTRCRSRCFSELITGSCPHCLPYSWAHLINNDANLPTCTLDDYTTCLRYNGWSGGGQCENNCKSPCHYKVYKLHRVIGDTPEQKHPHKGSIALYPVARPYPVFIEEELLTWSSFLAELGGVASLWLGASFIGVVHVFWFIMFDLPALFRKRSKCDEDGDKDTKSVEGEKPVFEEKPVEHLKPAEERKPMYKPAPPPYPAYYRSGLWALKNNPPKCDANSHA